MMGETPRFIRDGVEQLRRMWPQSHAVPSEHGAHLIVVPGVALPRGYRETICTVLFVAPIGSPGAAPNRYFFTDIDVRLADGREPYHTNLFNTPHLLAAWPQWSGCRWWKWCIQAWNPNRDTLFTVANVIRARLRIVQ